VELNALTRLGQVPHDPQRHRQHRAVERLAGGLGLGAQLLPFAPGSGWAPYEARHSL
jgi:hypothetical protein